MVQPFTNLSALGGGFEPAVFVSASASNRAKPAGAQAGDLALVVVVQDAAGGPFQFTFGDGFVTAFQSGDLDPPNGDYINITGKILNATEAAAASWGSGETGWGAALYRSVAAGTYKGAPSVTTSATPPAPSYTPSLQHRGVATMLGADGSISGVVVPTGFTSRFAFGRVALADNLNQHDGSAAQWSNAGGANKVATTVEIT